ncbi:MAG: PEP-CTERM sorting domain-containing protein [Proteobacteria bacterium]|nr:PEP-CTERM sorting domain-containing protein [Pseudomonadota bacterium]
MVADFAAAATLNGVTGWYEAAVDPTALAGSAKGIFQNDSTTNAANQGFYAFDFSFALGSWAAQQSATWSDGTNTYSPSAFFAAPAGAAPEPASLALVGLALAGLAALSRRRAG